MRSYQVLKYISSTQHRVKMGTYAVLMIISKLLVMRYLVWNLTEDQGNHPGILEIELNLLINFTKRAIFMMRD